MIPTVAVIPSRYERRRLQALALPLRREADVIVFDNGHEPPLVDPRITIIDARGDGIYRMWNRGWQLARERWPGKVNVAVLNDDIVILPNTLRFLAGALRGGDPKIGCVYPDASVRRGQLPATVSYTTEWDPAGGRSLTGFCFMFKGELDLPPFDEGMEWWYGDSEFDESVKLAGYGVARIDGVPITHVSDAESNDWARRPELKEAVERDGLRWADRHDRIVDGRWVPR